MDEIIKKVYLFMKEEKDKNYYINWIIKIYNEDKINYARQIYKIEQLKNYIIENTPLLNNQNYTFVTRISWIVNNITDFPVCPTCKKQYGFNKNIRLFRLYNKHCSVQCRNKDKILNQQIKNTCKLKGKQTAAKVKATCLKKYNVSNPSQVPEIINKIKLSLKKVYSNKKSRKKIQQKIKQTSLKKYGVTNYSKTAQFKTHMSNILKGNIEFIQKLNKIRYEKYGTTNVFEIPAIRQKQIKQKNDQAYSLILTWNQYVIPLFKREEYVSRSHHKIYKWKCVKCNNEFQFQLGKSTNVSNISGYIPACPICYPTHKNYSKKQKQLCQFCKTYFLTLIENDRNLIKPLQIDINIPQIKLAIQFNGIFWHSIDRKPPLYHLEKTLLCQEKGYRLIHIWENQWENNKEEIKNKLKQIFNNEEILYLSDQFILNREWYQYKKIVGYNCQIIMPSIIIRNNIKTENCGFLKYKKE